MKFHRTAAPLTAALLMASVSHAAIPANAHMTPAAANQPVEMEVFLPLRNQAGLDALLKAQQTVGSPSYHQWLTPAQFASQFGPLSASISRVRAAVEAGGLQVIATHTQSLHVRGTAAQVNKLLQTKLSIVTSPTGGSQLVASTKINPPTEMQQEAVVIPAFTGIPLRHTEFSKISTAAPDNRNGEAGPYNYNDMKQAYDYPSYQTVLKSGKRLDGSGVNVAILMETTALESDVQAMFNHEHFTTTTGSQPPTFTTLNVDGGAPFDPNSGGSFEASLDVQQVLGGAPGANVTLVSIPDLSDQHILDGYVTIVDQNQWDIVSSSFGGCELNYTAGYNGGSDFTGILKVFHNVFLQGNAEGITFIASSGDSGGLSCPEVGYFYGKQNPRFVASVETPADDWAVTAVGGTNLLTNAPQPTLASIYEHEHSYGDKEVPYDIYGLGTNVSGGYWGPGGGASAVFQQPAYQNYFFNGGGRRVPDVGMQVGGCPSGLSQTPCQPYRSAAIVTLAGNRYGVIGTSVSAPEFAGALALYEEVRGRRLGNINGYLYNRSATQDSLGTASAAPPAAFFHKNIQGYDGVYSGSKNVVYDYMVGNGTPDVRNLFDMTAFAAAGNPRTPSNP